MYVTKQIQNKLQKKKVQIHQRSILRQMMNTCDKLDSSFLTRTEQKQFQSKQRQERQLSRKTSFLDKQNLPRFSHDPFKSNKDNIVQEDVFVKQSKQFKQIKDLREKMLPKVNKTNIEKKLKELTYIRNMGIRAKDKRLESFKSLTREKDQENVLNKSWEHFYQDKIFNYPVESPSQREEQQEFVRDMQRKRTVNVSQLVKKKSSVDNENKKDIKKQFFRTMNKFQSTPGSFFHKAQKDPKTNENKQKNEIKQINFSKTNQGFMSTNITNTNSINHTHTNYIMQTISTQKLQPPPPSTRQRQSRISTRNKPQFRQVMKSLPRKTMKQSNVAQLAMQMMSSQRKKQITEKIGLNKERLEKQNAYKLYTLIKGGYNLDRNDVEGENFSLKRFKEAKENFKILNTCFNQVRQYRYIIQEPEKVFNDCTFNSIVYLSEIEHKINSSLFKRLQKINKVVD